MFIAPSALSGNTLSKEALEEDLRGCRKIGPCGVGSKALYIGGRFMERRFYLPWTDVTRVFKRVAMSAGGFSGRGVFGSMAYFVVQYRGGGEKACRVKYEGDVDKLLAEIRRRHPRIPTCSAQAEAKLAAAAAEEEARYKKDLSPEAEETLQQLQKAKRVLEDAPSLPELLTSAAKQKRIVDHISPAVKAAGAVCAALGIAVALYGLYLLLSHGNYGLYFVLGGGALFFATLSSNTLPTRWNSKKQAQKDWDDAVREMEEFLRSEKNYPVPAQYAHPVVLDRMIRVVREGRAQTAAEALAQVKTDLKALNSSVTVSQKEYDEVVLVKPLFLVCDYRDELA